MLILADLETPLLLLDERRMQQDSPGLGIPMNYVYFGMVIGSVYLGFVALRRVATHFGLREPAPASLGSHGCWSRSRFCCWS